MAGVVIYAKSKPPETLFDHTRAVVGSALSLLEEYGNRIKSSWPESIADLSRLLRIVATYHDLGKNYTPFQNVLRKSIKIDPLAVSSLDPHIPHSFLSTSFFLADASDLGVEDLYLKALLTRAIAFHHHREIMEKLVDPDNELLKEVIKEDIQPNYERLDFMKELGIILNRPGFKGIKRVLSGTWDSYWESVVRNNPEYQAAYTLLAGFLMKADHSASAHLPAEFEPFENTKNSILKYLAEKKIDISSLWQMEILDSIREKNVILIASTGMGKTELALLWNGDEKLFYTLPLRTSVNAMFGRMLSVFGDDGRIGLLHSTASAYLLKEIDESDKQAGEMVGLIDRAKQLSLPLSVSTADQLFTSTFKYPGYEKVYATLSYSNVVIDELQAYNPEIAAAILWGLKEVTELGSKFCLMTATLPGFYLDFVKENLRDFVIERRFLPVSKHRIELLNDNIIGYCDSIVASWKEKGKVLVVVNTVKQAQKLYEELKKRLKNESENNLMLLHSGFILRDRSSKEKRLLDKDNPFKGIVVSTQVVEASLDIDFPVLFTEIAPADSLIQRMGRVERKIREGKLNLEKPNVLIFWSDETSGVGSVYERSLVSGTGKLLENYSGKTVSEEDKQDIVNALYYSDNAKKVKEKFEKAIEMLKLGILRAKNRDDAQKLFRDISSIECIPFTVYEREEDAILKLVETVESSKERVSRLRATTKLQGYTLSVKRSRVPDSKIVKLIGSIAVINIPYDAGTGIQYEEEESPFV